MKTINLKDKLKGTSTNSEGYELKCILMPFFKDNEAVKISFKGTTPMSSSFFNSSFAELIDEYGYDSFRNIVRPINISSSHFGLIKKYIKMHIERTTA